MHDAATLLAIPETEPERLFGTADAVEAVFRDCAKAFHPDVCTAANAAQVFAHLAALKRAAEAKIRAGTWETPGLLTVTSATGVAHAIPYLKRAAFELGTLYISRATVHYVIAPAFRDLVANYVTVARSFRYPSDRVRGEVERYLPRVGAVIETADHDLVLEVVKTPELVRLRDLLDHAGGALDPRHAAWILSSLLNLACYFEVAGLTHNGLTADSYFISPEHHSGVLLGGWFYAAPVGAPLRALPNAVLDVAPRALVAAKTATARIDLESIRALGRELLGDRTGATLGGPALPAALVRWVLHPASGSALADYEAWPAVLKTSFGSRRFTKLDVTVSDIYRP